MGYSVNGGRKINYVFPSSCQIVFEGYLMSYARCPTCFASFVRSENTVGVNARLCNVTSYAVAQTRSDACRVPSGLAV